MIASALFTLLAALTVPQQPFSAGPLRSIAEVIGAASGCHVDAIRLDLGNTEGDVNSPGEARLYFIGKMPTPDRAHCLNSWLTQNGKRLHLKPRWDNDDFTHDAPAGSD